jgi:hypothetical protein
LFAGSAALLIVAAGLFAEHSGTAIRVNPEWAQ